MIGHDGAGIGSGWYIDSVTVDIESLGKHLVFPCHKWLATDEDDGKIERELFPVEERAVDKSTFLCRSVRNCNASFLLCFDSAVIVVTFLVTGIDGDAGAFSRLLTAISIFLITLQPFVRFSVSISLFRSK